MDTHMLTPEVLAGLNAARAAAVHQSPLLRIFDGFDVYPVTRAWDGGFAMDAETAPNLRGTVEFWDGVQVLYECLIVCSAEDGPERIYEYKRLTPASEIAPVADFVVAEDAPAALLERLA